MSRGERAQLSMRYSHRVAEESRRLIRKETFWFEPAYLALCSGYGYLRLLWGARRGRVTFFGALALNTSGLTILCPCR